MTQTVGKRTYIPFDAWAMKVNVPVSQLVRQGNFAWSCGQCPLDKFGQVCFPGDLRSQAELVVGYLDRLIIRGGYTNLNIAQLMVYYVEDKANPVTDVIDVIRSKLGRRCLITPVRVPHFYYDGMCIEVDVVLDHSLDENPVVNRKTEGLEITTLVGDQIVWVSCQASINPSQVNTSLTQVVEGICESSVLKNHVLIASDWILPVAEPGYRMVLERLWDAGLMIDSNAVLRAENSVGWYLTGSLILCRNGAVSREQYSRSDSRAHLHIANVDDLVYISATSRFPSAELLVQTRHCMEGIQETLERAGVTAGDILKLTARYVGEPTQQALHENMRLRHSYYQLPGPASTGVPVTMIGDEGRRIAISVMAGITA